MLQSNELIAVGKQGPPNGQHDLLHLHDILPNPEVN